MGNNWTLVCCCLVAKSCPTLCDPMTIACQAPLAMGFPRQEHWNGLPFPSPEDLPKAGIEPRSPAWAGGFLSSGSPGKSSCKVLIRNGRILCKGSWKPGSSLLKTAGKQCTSDFETVVPEGMNIRARKAPRQSAHSIPSSSLGKRALLETLEVAVAERWWRIPHCPLPACSDARCQAHRYSPEMWNREERGTENTEGEMQNRQRKNF